MKKYSIMAIVFWIGLSLFVMAVSNNMGLGELHNPGPRLFLFLLGLCLSLVSLYLLMESLFKMGTADETLGKKKIQTNLGEIIVVFGGIFVYPIVLESSAK